MEKYGGQEARPLVFDELEDEVVGAEGAGGAGGAVSQSRQPQ